MGSLSKRLMNRMRHLARSEDGTATIPFVMFVPFYMLLLLSSIEMGMLMIRHVMLERALDIAVRDLRLGTWNPPTNTDLKRRICRSAGLIPDCMNSVMVELRPVSKTTWSPLASGPTCVDRNASIQPVTSFVAGTSNDMMLIRACAKFDPIFPTTGLGSSLPKDNSGAYALVSSTAFVNEPRPGS